MISRGRLNSRVRLPWHLPFVTEFWDGSTGITITGAGVSEWAPIKGSHAFAQGTDAARPTYASGVLTFDGTDDLLVTADFTCNQPVTVVAVVRVVAAVTDRYFWDGTGQNNCGCRNVGTTTIASFRANSGADVTNTGPFTVGAYYILTAVYNGASSSLRSGLGTAATGDAGANNAGAWTLGARGDGANFLNCSFKAFGYAVGALTTAQQETWIRSVSQRYGVVV